MSNWVDKLMIGFLVFLVAFIVIIIAGVIILAVHDTATGQNTCFTYGCSAKLPQYVIIITPTPGSEEK